MIRLALLFLAGVMLSATPLSAAEHPEARPYDETADASADVDAAVERAAGREALVLVVMGANWCHDSRALAGLLGTPRFSALLDERYELVFVDAGRPQKDEGRNAAIARRFGIDSQENTPMLIVASAGGERLNSVEDAKSWRNAASRSEDEIYDYLAAFPH